MLTKREKAFIRSLHAPATRKKTNYCMVEGIRAFTTFTQSKHMLQKLFVTASAADMYHTTLQQYSPTLITDHEMQHISAAHTPSGVLGVFSLQHDAQKTVGSGIVCAGLQDPGNAGTLARTVCALNRSTLILINSIDPWSPKVIQASAGTIGLLTVLQYTWEELVALPHRPPLYALVVSGGVTPTKQHSNGLLVVGSEGHGIPKAYLNDCSEQLTIPMPGSTESLNAAVAGSIALYLTL